LNNALHLTAIPLRAIAAGEFFVRLKMAFSVAKRGAWEQGVIEKTKAELGIGAKARRIRRHGGAYELREPRLLMAGILTLKTAV